MSRYVFVHGAWHGAWCWYKVLPLLRKSGHEAIAIDLPSLGRDRTPHATVTLNMMADAVCDALAVQPGPSILVGHSMGGFVVSQVAERCPDMVEKLVYVTAFLLRTGETPIALAAQRPPIIPDLMTVSADRLTIDLNFDRIREGFYGQCSDEDVVLAEALLRPQSFGPLISAQYLTSEKFGRVPRVYIECLRDKAMDPALQRAMFTATPCSKVFSWDTDHSPFFSRPRELAECLQQLA
jgi:pimeloyl-ACP methyl ester carboxylesterase